VHRVGVPVERGHKFCESDDHSPGRLPNPCCQVAAEALAQ
jgi:hypothetical protein